MILLIFWYVAVYSEPKNFLCIPASAAGAVAVNPNEIKTLLVNGLTPSLINGILLFNNGSRSLPRNSPDWIVLDNWVFDSLLSVDK